MANSVNHICKALFWKHSRQFQVLGRQDGMQVRHHTKEFFPGPTGMASKLKMMASDMQKKLPLGTTQNAKIYWPLVEGGPFMQEWSNRKNTYCKIPKISPSMYKPSKYRPPNPVTQKNPPLNRPSKNKPLKKGLWKI